MGDEFQCFMESTNIMSKYAVAVKKTMAKLLLISRLEDLKTAFKFLKADKIHGCTATITRKAINGGDGLGIKVLCKLFFLAEKKFIDILQEKLAKLL